jgi:adhesin transport system outer membrane protein
LKTHALVLTIAGLLLGGKPALSNPTPTTAELPESLRENIRQALDLHPAVQSSQSTVDARQSQAQAVRQQFLPTPSVSIDKADERSRLALNQQTRILRLQQPVWTGGRLTAQTNRADAQTRQSQAENLRIRETLIEQTLQTAAALQALSHRTDALNDSETRHAALLQQVEHRVQQGYSPRADLSLARARWLAVRADLQAVRSEQAAQIARLRQLTGPSQAGIQVLDPGLFAPTPNHLQNPSVHLAEQLEAARSNSPVQSRLDAEIQALEQDLRIEQSGRMPQISLRVDQTHGDISGTERRFFLSLNATLGAGLSTQYKIQAVHDQMAAKKQEQDALLRDLQQNLTALNLEIDNNLTRARLLDDSYVETEAVMQSVERQYFSGRRTWQEVFNAVREWSQTRIQRIDATQAAWLACQRLHLKLHGATGFLTGQTDASTAPPKNFPTDLTRHFVCDAPSQSDDTINTPSETLHHEH